MIWELFGTLWAFVAGTVLGSFTKVVVDRLPTNRSLWTRSHCDHCGTQLRWFELLPVVSYLLQRGRCRACAADIPRATLSVEVLGGCFAVLCWTRWISGTPSLVDFAAWAIYFTFGMVMIAGALIDVRHRIIPDETTIYAVPFAIAASSALGAVGFSEWPDPNWQRAILGAALNGTFFAIFSLGAAYVARREALGWGDVKLVMLIGALTGPHVWPLLHGALFGAAVGIVALIIRRRSLALPFGPSLVAGALFHLTFGDLFLKTLFPGIFALTRDWLR